MLSYFSLGRCLYDVCDAVPDYQVNPDIDGPGPTYSYIIQITISLSVILVIGMLFLLIPRTLHFLNRHGLKIDEQKQETRLHVALETILITLEDFQRAQCCFTIAVKITSAITLGTNNDYLWQFDRGAIFASSFAGVTAPCIVLGVLMAFNQRESVLTFWLTFCTWISSLGLSFMLLASGQSVRAYPQAYGGSSPTQLRAYFANPARLHLLDALTLGTFMRRSCSCLFF
jgi:hypothetical protein